jgi:hypothetical protein
MILLKHFVIILMMSSLLMKKVERHVIDLIQKVMNRPASQINKDQALVPSKCTVLHNGTALRNG